MDVATWLHSLGLAQYEQAFRDNAVDADTLPQLTAEDLKDLGVSAVGHRRKLLDAIAKLKSTPTPLAGGALHAVEEQALRSAGLERSMPSPAERRHLTVMFCDLVGSTNLAQMLDPEDYREILGAYHAVCAETIARYDGFVAKYMGDGVLAYFGYPQSHEDEASRAVLAGLALADDVTHLPVPTGLDPLHVRVGISTGLVVVGDLIGSGSAREQSVAGETPSLAARLQSIAPPDAVIVAPTTRRLLGNEFELADLGLQDLKGFAEPVAAWRVLGLSAVESRYEAHRAGSTALFGRAKELELLLDCWKHTCDGQGQVVLLSGEAGIGKSQVVAGLSRHVQSPRAQHQCSPFFSSSPLHPIIEGIRRASGIRNDETHIEQLAKLEIHLPEATEDVTSLAPFIATMLSIPTDGRYPEPHHDPRRHRELTFEALIAYFLGRSRRQPLLMVFEDVHWADPSTLELLDDLIDHVASARLLLLMTFRPDFAFTRWSGRPHMIQVLLGHLTPSHSAELARAVAGTTELPADVLQQILDRTDGVPLFIEELTKAVLENNGTGSHSRSGRAPPAVPMTLHDSLMARLDRVPVAKAVAQQAAVIGREFTHELLAAISPQDEVHLSAALQQLVSSELIFPSGTPADGSYTFKHALVRDAAYESLLRRRRQVLHAHIAAILVEGHPEVATAQPELIAHHLSEAGLAERAVTYWQRAADSAARRQAHQEAIAHCNRGLAMTSLIHDQTLREGHELRLQVRLGNAATSARGFSAPEVGKALYRARELCARQDDHGALHTILVGLYYFHANKAELRAAEKLGLELLSEAQARKDRVLQVDAHKILLNARYKLAKFDEAREHLERGLNLYRESPWPEVSIEHLDDPGPNLLMFGACTLWVLGYPDRARRAVTDAAALARRSRHHFTMAYTVFMTGHFAELMEDWDGVKTADDETIALTTEWGLSGLRQHVPRREQLVAIARNCDREAMAAKRQHPQPGFARSLHDAVLARALGRCGTPDEGLPIIEESLRWSDETGSQFFDAELHRTRADLLLMMGQLDEAEHSYRKAMKVARDQNARMWELKAAMSLARMLRDQGRRADALGCLASIQGWFREGFDIRELQLSRAVLDTLLRPIPPGSYLGHLPAEETEANSQAKDLADRTSTDGSTR